MAHHAASITPFSENPDFDYEIRGILGQAVGGAADVGEVLAATAGIGKRDHVGWFRAWHELGQRTAEAAQAAAAAGHRVSAAECLPAGVCLFRHRGQRGQLVAGFGRTEADVP